MEHWGALKANPTSALDDQIWSPQALLAAYQALDSSLKEDKYPTTEGIRIWFAKNSRLVPDVSSSSAISSKNVSLQSFPSSSMPSFTSSTLPSRTVPFLQPNVNMQQPSNFSSQPGFVNGSFSPQTAFINNNPMFLPPETTPFRLPLQSTRPLPSLGPLQPSPKPEWRTSDTLPGLKVDIAQMVTRNQDLLCRSSMTSRRSSNHMVEEKALSLPGSSNRQRAWTLPPPPPAPPPNRQQSSPLPFNNPLPTPPSSQSNFAPDIERLHLEHLLAQKQLELEAFQLLMQQRLPRQSSEPVQQPNSLYQQSAQRSMEPDNKHDSITQTPSPEHKASSASVSGSSLQRSPVQSTTSSPLKARSPSPLLLATPSTFALSPNGTPRTPPPPPPHPADVASSQRNRSPARRTQSLEYELQDAHVRQLQNEILALKRSTSADQVQGNGTVAKMPLVSAQSDALQIQQLEQQMVNLQAEAAHSMEAQYHLSLVQQQLLDLKFGRSPSRSTSDALRSPGQSEVQQQSQPTRNTSEGSPSSVRKTSEASPPPVRKVSETSSTSPPKQVSSLQPSALQQPISQPTSTTVDAQPRSTRSSSDVSVCQDESKKNVSDRKKLRAAIKSSRTLIGAIASSVDKKSVTE